MIALASLALIVLTGPDKQNIEVNPEQVVSIRDNRDASGKYFASGIRCLIHTTDGKIVHVIEDCATVRRKLKEGP